MTHLGERITDFVFEELSRTEMDEARRHVAECAECRKQVQQFERTTSTLRLSADVEPPRRIVFETRKPPVLRRWLTPIGVAAAAVLAVWIAAPLQVQWSDSQLTISFGRSPAPTVPPIAAQMQPAAAVVQQIDYDRIIKELQAGQQASLAEVLGKYEAEQKKTVLRLQDQLIYLKAQQDAMEKKGIEMTSYIQTVIAQRSGEQD